MSYNQKPPGSSGSGMGGGPPNGPNNMPQVAKTFAGIQQQMQNLVHGQNAIPQSSQADINAFLQQQRIQNMLKQQQQFLQFQHQMQQQQQQHQQQQHQHHNMAGAGPGTVGGVPGVGGVAGPGPGGPAVSGEPLALTRTAGAAELLNKTYQQQANGNPAANPTFNQLQQTLQALPTNFVQHLQVFQYQMQAKQMQQQQHAGGQAQHGLGQQQAVQGASPTSATAAMPHQQQQQQQQKHQNQQQQQQNALSRYLTAAAAQVAAASGNKMSSATPPPPPLTNQMKPPNLPPNTQITPVAAANISGGNISTSPHSKASVGNAGSGSAKHSAPPASISLMPSKTATSSPSVAHQQNKFTPPTNSGAKGGHMGHSQNLPKSTHGATHTATSNTTSPAKTGANADATVAALKSPQSTPVQLTKQMPPTTTTAATGNKAQTSATTAATTAASAVASTTVSPLKLATTPTTALASTTTSPSTTSASVGSVTTNTPTAAANTTLTKSSNENAKKTALADESVGAKTSVKPVSTTDKETTKSSSNEVSKPVADSSTVDSSKKEPEKTKEKEKEKKTEPEVATKKPAVPAADNINAAEKASESKQNNTLINSPNKASGPLESKHKEEKEKTPVKLNKSDHSDVNENEKNMLTTDKVPEKNKPTITDEKNTAPLPTSSPETAKQQEPPAPADLSQVKNSHEEKKLENKEKVQEKDKDKNLKSNKLTGKMIEQADAAASKETQKADTLADKPTTTVETKATAAVIAQNAGDKTLKKDETNDTNVTEASKKKEAAEHEQKKADKQPVSHPAAIEEDTTKALKAGVSTENKKNSLPKEKEAASSEMPGKSIEKPETTTEKSLPQATANKKVTEDDINKNSVAVAAPKETLNAVTKPAKKVARLTKVAKSKSTTVAAASGESKATEVKEEKPTASTARVKRKPKADNSLGSSNSALSTPKDDDSDRKSKRHRLKTILYQSPLPELAYITKLSASEASNSPKPMSNEDRLIVFYKNEYMAVRNAEGTFYLCQTMQNVYRTSPRISIRWLSEDTNDNNVFIPDFYDHTDIECVLTTVELKRIDKGHLRLPDGERSRIESILKKAIDVEKGLVPRPELTEENPDGLDISLFKDESQIEKKSALTEGSESHTTSLTAGRKSRRGAASSARKSSSSATPSTSSAYKRKRDGSSTAKSSSSSRKSLTKKRKTLVKRKRKLDRTDDEDDDDETSDDCESDAEYKPTQKRSTLNVSGAARSAPRAQRSPLAKARAASPITPTTSRSKSVPQKSTPSTPTPTPTPTPSTSKASRGERAAKRKSIIDAGSSEESSAPVKKQPTTTSNNKSKATTKKNKH